MNGVDPRAFKFALTQINDGKIFENFGLDFLSKVLGYEFIPAGGIRDRGIDGFEYSYHRKGNELTIYQLSITQQYKRKIRDSLDTLKKNKIRLTQFVYVTNIDVKSQDLLLDELIQKYHIPITIFDQKWMVSHINDSPATIQSFQTFINSFLYEFNKPGHSYVVANLHEDPRLYVFLRQQLDERKGKTKLEEILTDSLILYALEDTNPDLGNYKNKDEIIEDIKKKVKFDPRILEQLVDKRLGFLSKKPTRRIHYNSKFKGYCLDYSERLNIQNRNLNDTSMYVEFKEDTKKAIEKLVPSEVTSELDFFNLVENLLNQIFYKQGMEFANFTLHGESKEIFEVSLPEIVNSIIDASSLVVHNRQIAKSALLAVIRDIVYGGTISQRMFLNRLSHTYVMIFLLQCDPKLCIYFNSMASHLRVYICSSILIPAMSEHFLNERNRRYSNLLKRARAAGVKLIINEAILEEMAAHFNMTKNRYREQYKYFEDTYTDELVIPYIPEIMIRAYFHAKVRGQVKDFERFLGHFIDPSASKIEESIIEWMKTEFDIEFIHSSSMGIKIDENKFDKIVESLVPRKQHTTHAELRAKRDAQIMLTIHALRERDNESGSAGIFGFKTWWLTSDVTTERAAVIAAGSRNYTTCYMRPDFLYNYISFAPPKAQIEQAYSEIFPTLLGINISFNMPTDVIKIVHEYVKEYGEMNPARIRGALRQLSEELKQCPDDQLVEKVTKFIEEKRIITKINLK